MLSVMIRNTISTAAARRFYNRMGHRLDWSDAQEGWAKYRAVHLLQVKPGQRVVHVGVGTGKTQAQLARATAPYGYVCGVDIASVLLHLTAQRVQTPLSMADARALPFYSACFDGLLCSYVLDLLPADDLIYVLKGFARVLKPGGRMVLVSLTEGSNLLSRLFIALWKGIYWLNPLVCGGCRPLQLAPLVAQTGFTIVHSEVIVQHAFPSEVLLAVADEA